MKKLFIAIFACFIIGICLIPSMIAISAQEDQFIITEPESKIDCDKCGESIDASAGRKI